MAAKDKKNNISDRKVMVANSPTIDEMLDAVDLSFSNYEPSEEALEFFAIVRVLHGEDFEIPNQKIHYFMVDMMYGNVKQEDFPYTYLNDRIPINARAVAMILSRGMSKSTVASLFFPIVCAIKGRTPITGPLSNILILSDTQDGGAKDQFTIMKETLEKNKSRASMFFESWKCVDNKIEMVRKGTTDITKRHMRIVFKGITSGGIRSGSRNPVTSDRYAIIIADDIIAREDDAKSDVLMNKVRSGLFVDAENAMRSKNTQVILINTLYTKTDPIYSTVESGAYTPLVIPICKKIYDDMPEKEFQGAWPEMHGYEDVMLRYIKAVTGNTRRGFMQELMCRISDDTNRIISDKDIKWYSRTTIIRKIKHMNFYVTTDFTSSEEASRTNDYSGMMLWGVDGDRHHWLLDMHIEKLGIEDQYDVLFEMIDRWCRGALVEIGVEVDGNQRAHMIALKKKMQLEDKSYMFARQKGSAEFVKPGSTAGILSKRAGRDKLERFKMMSPMFTNGTIHFPKELEGTPDMDELLRELRYCTWQGIKGHDDAIDLLSMLNSIEVNYPPKMEEPVAVQQQQVAVSAGQALFTMMNKGMLDNPNEEKATGYSSYV